MNGPCNVSNCIQCSPPITPPHQQPEQYQQAYQSNGNYQMGHQAPLAQEFNIHQMPVDLWSDENSELCISRLRADILNSPDPDVTAEENIRDAIYRTLNGLGQWTHLIFKPAAVNDLFDILIEKYKNHKNILQELCHKIFP